jgi:hypothetical protein
MPFAGNVRVGDWSQEVQVGVDTAIYAAGDLLFDTQEVLYAVMENGTSIVLSLVVTDYDDQGAAFDVLVFRSNPGSLGVLNAAIALSAAQVDECIGWFPVQAANYTDLGTRRVGCERSIGLQVHPTNSTSIWVGGVSRGTPTYANGRLKLLFGFMRG